MSYEEKILISIIFYLCKIMDNILLLGSSIIKKWNIKDDIRFNNYNIENKGISKLLTKNLLEKKYLTMLSHLEKNINYIIIYIGGNDIRNYNDMKWCKKSLENIDNFINILKKKFNNAKIIFISVIKSPLMYILNKIKNINYFNNKLSKICKSESNLIYIDVNKYLDNKLDYYDYDKIHLHINGYYILGKRILYYIQKK